MSKTVILVTGSGGQIGTVLVEALRKKYGVDNVIATDLKPRSDIANYEQLDINNISLFRDLIKKYQVNQIYHLAALLSSKGEENIHKTWDINLMAYLRILELSRELRIDKIFFPSTIGIYGQSTPKEDTPQHASFEPETMYGITKYTGELWSAYYRKRYNMDIRSLRYPGVISYQSIPKGGTTDYAVEIFFEAIKKQSYTCYLSQDTALPMIYMPDVIRATLLLMDAPKSDLSLDMSYNVSGFSITPSILYQEIKKHIPEFQIQYQPDQRQKIADSWTGSIDDSYARNDWNWNPAYDIPSMTKNMIENIKVLDYIE